MRYVTCCSTGDSVESWRGPQQQRDGGVLIDIESDLVISEGLSMPHSPRVIGEAIYLIESGRGVLVRVDRQSGRRDDVVHCPGFARGLALAGRYAVLTISLPRSSSLEMFDLMQSLKARGASPWRGLLIVDLTNGDIVEWMRLEGDVMELFDVAVVPEVRCPRGLGARDRELGAVGRME